MINYKYNLEGAYISNRKKVVSYVVCPDANIEYFIENHIHTKLLSVK